MAGAVGKVVIAIGTSRSSAPRRERSTGSATPSSRARRWVRALSITACAWRCRTGDEADDRRHGQHAAGQPHAGHAAEQRQRQVEHDQQRVAGAGEREMSSSSVRIVSIA
jgi:hypothetical protein